MGRIKPLMVKKVAAELYEGTPGFGEDFEINKKLLKDTTASKSVRNKIAGGIVTLAKQKRKREEAKANPVDKAESEQEDGQDQY